MADFVHLGSKVGQLTAGFPANTCPQDWNSVWGEFTCLVELRVPPDFRIPSIEETAGLHFERKFQFECKLPFTTEKMEKIKLAYGRAGRGIAGHGQFFVGLSFEEKSAQQTPSYCDYVTVTAFRGSYEEKVFQKLMYSRNKGGSMFESQSYAFREVQQMIQACDLPIRTTLEENTIRFTAENKSNLLVKEVGANKQILLAVNLPDEDFKGIIEKGHIMARDRAKRFWDLSWGTEVYFEEIPTRVPPFPPEKMIFDFLNHMKQAALPAEGQVLEFYAKIKNPQGLAFIQALCGPLDQVEIPVYSIPVGKRQKCYATLMVEADGPRWALRSSHALEEQQITDFGRKLGVVFSPKRATWRRDCWSE